MVRPDARRADEKTGRYRPVGSTHRTPTGACAAARDVASYDTPALLSALLMIESISEPPR